MTDTATPAWKPDVMIYHHPCADGFGAAWSAWMRWGDDVVYHPTNYGAAPPDVAGKHVLIGDFSYPRAVLDEMAHTAASIVVLDHHKTAEEDLAPFAVHACGAARLSAEEVPGMLRDLDELGRPPIVASFDMERSGARMVWDFCFENIPPLLIRLVEDRDLWRFRLHNSRAFSLWLRAVPLTFDGWREIARLLESGSSTYWDEALAVERFYDHQVREIAGAARIDSLAGAYVPMVACPASMSSDVGHALLNLYPDAPFAACYQDKADGRYFSLRSTDERTDVSEIAAGFGGGGHRNAAGFKLLNGAAAVRAALADTGVAV